MTCCPFFATLLLAAATHAQDIKSENAPVTLCGTCFSLFEKPLPLPDTSPWLKLIGEYGDNLYILERNNQLTALIKPHDYYPLTPIAQTKYRFPTRGLSYDGPGSIPLHASGRPAGPRFGGALFPCRPRCRHASVF